MPPYVLGQSDPGLVDLASRAAAARDAGNVPLAIQLYIEAERSNPDWQEGWWNLGLLQYNSGQYAEGIESLTHFLQLRPNGAAATALRGLCEFETGAYDDSLRDLQASVEHGPAKDGPSEGIVRLHLAELLTHAGKFQDAIDQYRILAMQHVEAPDIRAGITLAGMRIPRFPKEIPEEYREVYQGAGEAARSFLAGDNQSADELFAGLFVNHPSIPHLHFLYGFLLYPHDSQLAAEQLAKELAVNPEDEYANAMMALALVLGGRFTDALEPAKRAYAFAPNGEMAQLALGRALAETGDLERGAELLRKVIELNPNNLEAHLGLASIYSQSGNREEADREHEVCHELAM
jgi:tetratricopeptide (TPR) repeat protein